LKAARNEINKLWDVLEVKAEDRDAFLKSTAGLGSAVVVACESECAKLKTQKAEKMAEIIGHVRDDIHAVWDKLGYGTEQRAAFLQLCGTAGWHGRHGMSVGMAAQQDAFYDELLEMHQTELRRLNKIVGGQEQLRALIDERESLLKQREIVDTLDKDESRKLPRGNAFIEELKTRERVHQLPMKTENLKKLLQTWSAEHEPIMVNGVDYLTKMEDQDQTYKHTQESAALVAKRLSLQPKLSQETLLTQKALQDLNGATPMEHASPEFQYASKGKVGGSPKIRASAGKTPMWTPSKRSLITGKDSDIMPHTGSDYHGVGQGTPYFTPLENDGQPPNKKSLYSQFNENFNLTKRALFRQR